MLRLLFLALLCSYISIMGTEPVLLSSYPIHARTVAVDNLSNFYSTTDYRLSKYDRDGKFILQYEEVKYGKITSVDVTNPMKIVLWYGDFMTAIVLDRYLSPVAVFNFFDLGYQNVAAVGSSSEGQLWFYDLNDTRIRKIDVNGAVSTQSQPMNLILRTAIAPTSIIERNGKVYLCDPAIGILLFDNFGTYSRTIPILGVRQVQILQDQIVYTDAGKLQSFNPITLQLKTLTLPDSTGVIQSVIERERLCILKVDSLFFYNY